MWFFATEFRCASAIQTEIELSPAEFTSALNDNIQASVTVEQDISIRVQYINIVRHTSKILPICQTVSVNGISPPFTGKCTCIAEEPCQSLSQCCCATKLPASARRDRKHTVFEGIVPETSRNSPSGNAVGFGTKGSKTYCFRRNRA